jgi:HD-GYP domain-containing protein (c-di-GMP phosphodiesterase class II)
MSALLDERSPYRKAMSPFEAKDILVKGRGTGFDPDVVDAFLSAVRFGEDARPIRGGRPIQSLWKAVGS